MRMIDVRAGEFLPSLDFHGKTGRIEGGRWGGRGLCLLLQAALHTLMIQASSFF
jgi:hypothetical protein